MTCRRHGSKPTLALWMVVAVADVALVLATAGLTTMLVLAAVLVTLAAVAYGFRHVARQHPAATDSAGSPMTVRRRA